MRYRLTLVSSNKKTGPIPVTTSSRETCPTSCPLMGNGCYAEHGPIASVWRRTTEQGVDFNTLLAMIRRIPRGALWRWAQAGDLPGAGDDIDRQQLRLLTAANRGRPIAFTHKPPTPDNLEALREAEAKGLLVNLSADSPGRADELLATGLPVVTVLHSEYGRRKANGSWAETLAEWRRRIRPLPRRTPGGTKIALCPATYTDVSCAACQVCARRRPGNTVIGFPAHGTRQRAVDAHSLSSQAHSVRVPHPAPFCTASDFSVDRAVPTSTAAAASAANSRP